LCWCGIAVSTTNMEEAGILENLALLTPLLPDFEPGPLSRHGPKCALFG
jgi:hypothetical protein